MRQVPTPGRFYQPTYQLILHRVSLGVRLVWHLQAPLEKHGQKYSVKLWVPFWSESSVEDVEQRI